MRRLLVLALALLAVAPASAQTFGLNNGLLDIQVRNDNGAIFSATFTGNEFYRSGFFASDFGFQNGTDSSSFALVDTNGSTPAGVTLGSVTQPGGANTAVIAAGTYSGGGANVAYTRTYTLVPGRNLLSVSSSFTNNGGAPVTLRLFDSADPDQVDTTTTNDVTTVNAFTVAQASNNINGLTAIYGFNSSGGIIGFGGGTSPFGLTMGSGDDLNTFFTTPYDPNNDPDDIGFAVAREFTLAAGASADFTYLNAFGSTLDEARAEFATAVPEPTTIAYIGFAACVGGYGVWRRRQKQNGVKAASRRFARKMA